MNISVVIPVYNSISYVEQCLDSILGQTYSPSEIIVVDDGSTDGSGSYIQGLYGDKIKLITKRNGGAGSARNVGVNCATSEWVAFCDSDDVWLPNHLELFFSSIRGQELIKWYMSLLSPDRIEDADLEKMLIQNDGACRNNATVADSSNNRTILVDYLRDKELFGWNLSVVSLVVKKDLLLEVGLFSEELKTGQDVDLLVKLALSGNRLLIIPEITALARKNRESLSWLKSFSYSHSSNVLLRRINLIEESHSGSVRRLFRINLWIYRLMKRTWKSGSLVNLLRFISVFGRYVSIRWQCKFVLKDLARWV